MAIDPLEAQEQPRPEDFRPYLLLIARAHFGTKRDANLDPSDIVQQTLLDACRQPDQFRGLTEAQMASWLKRIMQCNIVDAFRARSCKKRDVLLERSFEPSLDETCSRLEMWIEAVQTSPIDRASRNEQLLQLASVLSELPQDQCEAIELHHLYGLTLAETAQRLDRSVGSVIGLCRRGLSKLREALKDA